MVLWGGINYSSVTPATWSCDGILRRRYSRRFFRDLTENRLRRGIFRSVEELITAIFDYIDHHHESPTPFIWSAKAAHIMEKVKRARAALHNGQSA